MTLAEGTRLGSYELRSLLGAGGMGEVYRARHLKLGRDVAIKVLPAELDPESSEAHETLAALRMTYDWDWEGSEAEFRRALELNPSNADARAFHAHLLTLRGKTEEGFAEMKEALRLDPLNPFYQVMYAIQLVFAGRFDEAITTVQTTMEKTPGLNLGRTPLWVALDHVGRHAEALEVLKGGSSPEIVQALEEGNAEGGYRLALRRAAQTLESRSHTAFVGAVNIANLYDSAGDVDKAFEWLERAYEEHASNMEYCAVILWSEELRKDPRFEDLLERMNLTSVVPR